MTTLTERILARGISPFHRGEPSYNGDFYSASYCNGDVTGLYMVCITRKSDNFTYCAEMKGGELMEFFKDHFKDELPFFVSPKSKFWEYFSFAGEDIE